MVLIRIISSKIVCISFGGIITNLSIKLSVRNILQGLSIMFSFLCICHETEIIARSPKKSIMLIIQNGTGFRSLSQNCNMALRLLNGLNIINLFITSNGGENNGRKSNEILFHKADFLFHSIIITFITPCRGRGCWTVPTIVRTHNVLLKFHNEELGLGGRIKKFFVHNVMVY